jgi:hypothetical protein
MDDQGARICQLQLLVWLSMPVQRIAYPRRLSGCRWHMQIEKGHHGKTKLDGLKTASILKWPGPIHEGKGEALIVIDKRANAAQRESLLRILSGQDTEPGATIFNVFASTLTKVHDPIFSQIDFKVDIAKRKARLVVEDLIETRGEPILNPITGKEHRVRIDMVGGFEYKLAEIGRGWSKTTGPIAYELADTYGQFCDIHLSQSGIVR